MEFTKEQKDSQISQIEKQWKTYRVEKEICAGGPATVYQLRQLKQFRSLCPISEGDFAGYSEWVKKHQNMMTLLQSETNTAILDGMVRFAELYGEGDAVDVFKKAAERVRSEIENQENIQPGAIIEFGHYPQTAGWKDNTPIKWRVLKSEGKRALVISEMGIDCKEYHGKIKDVTWADCDLRKWLNSEFKAKAFNNEEIKKVQMCTNENKDNSQYGTKGGKATEDQVFLLSLEEAEKYFKDDDSRRCKATEYAVKQGAYVNTYTGSKANGFSWWWLRSPGYDSRRAASVSTDGSLGASGDSVYNGYGVVRPALWLEI